jgi:spore coat polysaccharide biosynthesis protein SpsF
VNAVIVIPMRLGASRLPGKGLAPIGPYRAVELLVGRLRVRATSARSIVLCTTRERGDDALASVAAELGIDVYRGSTEDVLLRLTEGAESVGAEWAAEVDGDDILCDPAHVDLALQRAAATGADCLSFANLPIGVTSHALRVAAMRHACTLKGGSDTSTGFLLPLTTRPEFRVVRELADSAYEVPRARMTLDYPEDLEFFRAVVARFPGRELQFSLGDLVDLLRRDPALVEINAGLSEMYWERFNRMKTTA